MRSPVQNKPGTRIRFGLLARRLNVDVNFLGTAASEKTTPVDKEQHQNDDHEDRQYGYNPCAAATVPVFSHEDILLRKVVMSCAVSRLSLVAHQQAELWVWPVAGWPR